MEQPEWSHFYNIVATGITILVFTEQFIFGKNAFSIFDVI